MNDKPYTAAEKLFIVQAIDRYGDRNGPAATVANLKYISSTYIKDCLGRASSDKSLSQEGKKLAQDLRGKIRE